MWVLISIAGLFAARISNQKSGGCPGSLYSLGLSLIFLACNFRCPYLASSLSKPGQKSRAQPPVSRNKRTYPRARSFHCPDRVEYNAW